MNNEIPDPPQPTAADAPPPQPADVLRSLLDVPKPEDEVWQAKAGRAVSMMAVAFLNELSDEAALRAVALHGLAQSLGVKDARKRALKLTRWTETAPPSLIKLQARDEQQAALGALAKMRAPWTRSYVADALANLAVSDKYLAELLKWGRKALPDLAKFTRDLYAPQIAAAKSPERVALLLKEAPKLLKQSKPIPASVSANCIAELISAFCESPAPEAADDKRAAGSVTALLHVLQEQASALPAVLLQPAFVMGAARLASATSRATANKQVALVCGALSVATISLLMAELDRAGEQAASQWRPMMATWRAAYPHWDQNIADAALVVPAMAALATEAETDEQTSRNAYASEAVFARLLPAWDAFVAELPDGDRTLSLSAMLRQAAKSVGVVPIGEKDEVIGYDPLSHELATAKGDNPSRVRVVRPGVQVIRTDGSTRVLVAALVIAA